MKFEFNQIIVGNSLLALSNAYYRGLPILIHGRPQYFFFDKIGDKTKAAAWREMAFQLNMAGLVPFGDSIESIRSDDGVFYEVTTKGGKRREVICRSSEPCEPAVHKTMDYDDDSWQESVEIIDWFTVLSGRVHDIEQLNFHTSAVNQIVFYPTKRFFAHDKFKDLVCKSYARKDQLENQEYEEWKVRWLVMSRMKEAGIKGSKNGIRPSGTQKYLALNIEFDKRVVRPNYVGEDDEIALVLATERLYTKKTQEMIEQWGDPLA